MKKRPLNYSGIRNKKKREGLDALPFFAFTSRSLHYPPHIAHDNSIPLNISAAPYIPWLHLDVRLSGDWSIILCCYSPSSHIPLTNIVPPMLRKFTSAYPPDGTTITINCPLGVRYTSLFTPTVSGLPVSFT